MPTYVYACKSCAHRFEQYQSFTEDSLRTCPECAQDTLRKVFDSVCIVFKGPGFYSTDSATSGASTSTPGSSAGSASEDSGGTSSTSGSAETSSSTTAPASTGSSSSEPAATAS